jgi:hypothetical protein
MEFAGNGIMELMAGWTLGGVLVSLAGQLARTTLVGTTVDLTLEWL